MLKFNDALEKGNIYIDQNKKLIKNFSKIPLYNDEPQVFAYSIGFKVNKNNSEGNATGVSYDKKRALMKVIGETMERIALLENKTKLIYASFDKIKNNAIDPKFFLPFSKKQLSSKYYKKFNLKINAKFNWIQAYSFLNKKNIYVPAQLVYVNHEIVKNEPLIREMISTGAATGSSLSDAIYRGICEIIERDSFMIGYLNKLSQPIINIDNLNNSLINKILKNLERYRLEYYLIDSTTDIGIPSVVAIVIDRTGKGPAVSIGLKAGFDIEDNIIGAIEEALMSRSWLRDEIYYGDRKKKHKQIISFYDRGLYWFSVDMLKNLDFWINSKKSISLNKLKIKNEEKLDKILQKVLGFSDVLYIDIAPKNVKKLGFSIVKVLAPKLIPVYLDEGLKYRGFSRLYEAPVAMGYLKYKSDEEKLNTVPHPFL